MTRRWDYSYTPGVVARAFLVFVALVLVLLAVQETAHALAYPGTRTVMTAGVCVIVAVTGLAVVGSWMRRSRTLRLHWIEIGAGAVSWTKTRFGMSGLRTEYDHVPLELVRGVNFLHDSDGECVWLLSHDGCDRVIAVLRRDWGEFADVLRARLPGAVVLENGEPPARWPPN